MGGSLQLTQQELLRFMYCSCLILGRNVESATVDQFFAQVGKTSYNILYQGNENLAQVFAQKKKNLLISLYIIEPVCCPALLPPAVYSHLQLLLSTRLLGPPSPLYTVEDGFALEHLEGIESCLSFIISSDSQENTFVVCAPVLYSAREFIYKSEMSVVRSFTRSNYSSEKDFN